MDHQERRYLDSGMCAFGRGITTDRGDVVQIMNVLVTVYYCESLPLPEVDLRERTKGSRDLFTISLRTKLWHLAVSRF